MSSNVNTPSWSPAVLLIAPTVRVQGTGLSAAARTRFYNFIAAVDMGVTRIAAKLAPPPRGLLC